MVVGDGRLEADNTVGDSWAQLTRDPHIVPGRLSQITPARWVEAKRKRPPPGPTVQIQCENEEREEVNRKQEQIATDLFELEFENW